MEGNERINRERTEKAETALMWLMGKRRCHFFTVGGRLWVAESLWVPTRANIGYNREFPLEIAFFGQLSELANFVPHNSVVQKKIYEGAHNARDDVGKLYFSG